MSHPYRIDVEQLQNLLDGKEHAMLLDMRDARAYCQGHDPRAIHLSDLTLRSLLRSTPRQLNIVIYCADGKASREMVRLFADFGFERCVSLDGGYAAWQSRRTRTERFSSVRVAQALAV